MMLVLLVLINFVYGDFVFRNSIGSTTTQQIPTTVREVKFVTDLAGGVLRDGQHVLSFGKSPFVLKEDLVVERNAELVIEPGVEIRFGPTVGITVRGRLDAVGAPDQRIRLISNQPPPTETIIPKDIRLVDGPSILSGRVQLKHNGIWWSVCTNSRNWTLADFETFCRHLGFQGGTFQQWHTPTPDPHRMYLQPQCHGTETRITACSNFQQRKAGSGSCDYHPDLGVTCFPFHDGGGRGYWRGIRFEYAHPLSRMEYIDVEFAGSGRGYNVTSALEIEGATPILSNLKITKSAYNALNITHPTTPLHLHNTSISENRGYGVFINSSTLLSTITGSNITSNSAPGVRYVHHTATPLTSKLSDFCTIPTTLSQTYPIQISMDQSKYSTQPKNCEKNFYGPYGQVLTLSFDSIFTTRNDSGTISVYDGVSDSDLLLGHFTIRNHTHIQTIQSSRNRIFVKFHSDSRVESFITFRLWSSLTKIPDLTITSSVISDNSASGIEIDKLKSRLIVTKSKVSHNSGTGLRITSGVGDVNVTKTRIESNFGDGINITVSGGTRNVSRSWVSKNNGAGVTVTFDNRTEFEYFQQNSVIEYSDFRDNVEFGVLHGNYCGDSIVNITGNVFTEERIGVEVKSCWKESNLTTLLIGYNRFYSMKKLGIKLRPALNVNSRIEYNHFRSNAGAVLIKNQLFEQFNGLETNILIENNEFYQNRGSFVLNIGLSPYSDTQRILVTRNYIRDNRVIEPFSEFTRLQPRSQVSAAIVVSSANVVIFRNILNNPESKYEIGSHLSDQSKVINCTFNWLGSAEESKIWIRLFDRKDRYNLAKIQYLPYLLHSSNPGTTAIIEHQTFVPQFQGDGGVVGGEVEGLEVLKAGVYVVVRDINVRVGGKLVIEPGVILEFVGSVGMMVGGKLDARGRFPNDIKFTLKDTEVYEVETEASELNEATETLPEGLHFESASIRLLGGKTPNEGRLQIKLNSTWGTVCNYRWTQRAAALVCHQLGLALNPQDWYLPPPPAGTSEPILVTGIDCDDEDTDIFKCRMETHFENSCTHEQDVGVRCYEPSWAGIRFSPIAERSDLQYLTVEKAGLLDYATLEFKAAVQLDFAKHSLESVIIQNNYQDGIGIIYSDLYSNDAVNIIKNSIISSNRGNGISFRQLGLKIQNCQIESNSKSGISHNPELTALHQRELSGWFGEISDAHRLESTIPIEDDVYLLDETKYFVTPKASTLTREFIVKTRVGFVIGMQLLNPIESESTEEVFIKDGGDNWNIRRDLSMFPATTSGPKITVTYRSGEDGYGGVVLILTPIPAPRQIIRNRIIKGPHPTLQITGTRIRSNLQGITSTFYNSYYAGGNETLYIHLRKSNSTIKIFQSDISHNIGEALLLHTPFEDRFSSPPSSNLSEFRLVINSTLITDNAGGGLRQISRDWRSSSNLFHFVLQDNTIERNGGNGMEVIFPTVGQYNENFTHSVYMDNCTWRENLGGVAILGHFALVNITKNLWDRNRVEGAILTLGGMEKKMQIDWNNWMGNIGKHMASFEMDSQSEILGEVYAFFIFNTFDSNSAIVTSALDPSSVIRFRGLQKVRIHRNLLQRHNFTYSLIAGIRTAKLNNFLDIRENYWGSSDMREIKSSIFDFDNWNNHALTIFQPYLTSSSFESSISLSQNLAEENYASSTPLQLGGRLQSDLILYPEPGAYQIYEDLTIMPGVTMEIRPGVVLEFAPNVGILCLGVLKAKGLRGMEIEMRPMQRKIVPRMTQEKREVRLVEGDENEGFLEFYNSTTSQWVPVCDPHFTDRNAQVVCTHLGYSTIATFSSYSHRISFAYFYPPVSTYPPSYQCTGTENSYSKCPVRNPLPSKCHWKSNFVFIHCGRDYSEYEYWGGVRITGNQFEGRGTESTLEFVNIWGAGMLHGEKSPGIQSVWKSPAIQFTNVSRCSGDGVQMISPGEGMKLMDLKIEENLGIGINILSLTGETLDSSSSFEPLTKISIPYNIFGLLDICDSSKEVVVEDRLLIFYKYDSYQVNCVKIFKSWKPFGFRLLQYNLKTDTKPEPSKDWKDWYDLDQDSQYPDLKDQIELYDGDIYNVTTKLQMAIIQDGDQKKFFKTIGNRLSVKFVGSGGSGGYGFVAEIVTLPISVIGFNRDVQHNITHSEIISNIGGGVAYASVGEINPIVTIQQNYIFKNCAKLYGNFTTCQAAVDLDMQNTQNLYFRNNLVSQNQGGLLIHADSRGSATSLKGFIHNNLFTRNVNLPTLRVEGRSGPYQQVQIYRNYFSKNWAKYQNLIVLKQVVSNFSVNYVYDNTGAHILQVSGFEKVRAPIYQTTKFNGFYNNLAVERDSRSTILAGTAGQLYVDNIFFNPDNDYEMVTINRSIFIWNSTFDQYKSLIDARHNYWGYNDTSAVSGRIRDLRDDAQLLEVLYDPFYMTNKTLLQSKCPPGWSLVGDTCYIFIAAPMPFEDARAFCIAENGSMPYIMNNYYELYRFLSSQNQWFQYSDRVWVQNIDRINSCTMFTQQTIEVASDCRQKNPFICEIDPKIFIDPLSIFRSADTIVIAVIVAMILTCLLIGLAILCWCNKNRHRHIQRLERRNSIRQSLHSLRSVGSQSEFGGFRAHSRGKSSQMSTRSTDTLTTKDYRKMVGNGSMDSFMDKSTFNSSIEDNQSYDIYEKQMNTFDNDVTVEETPIYKNSEFYNSSASTPIYKNNYDTTFNPVVAEETPIYKDYYNSDTLPISDAEYFGYSRNTEENYPMKPTTFGQKFINLPPKPPTPSLPPKPPKPPLLYDESGLPKYAPKAKPLLETDFELGLPDWKPVETVGPAVTDRPATRSKSEALLETDFNEPEMVRSHSQPLETAM